MCSPLPLLLVRQAAQLQVRAFFFFWFLTRLHFFLYEGQICRFRLTSNVQEVLRAPAHRTASPTESASGRDGAQDGQSEARQKGLRLCVAKACMHFEPKLSDSRFRPSKSCRNYTVVRLPSMEFLPFS